MDQLESKHQEILYTMFEWPSMPKSKLILIGKCCRHHLGGLSYEKGQVRVLNENIEKNL